MGIVQLSCTKEVNTNVQKTFELTQKAIRAGAKIVCLQELFYTQYFCQNIDPLHFEYAIELKHHIIEKFQILAQNTAATILLPIFEKRSVGIYHNTVIVISPSGTIQGLYRKMHIPDDPSFYEKYYFSPGDLGFPVFETPYAKIGVLICYDQWFPEAARLAALQGAEILFYPTAIGWWEKEPEEIYSSQLSAWKIMHQSHAIANNIFVVAVNRVGKEGELAFWGNSLVVSPFGEIIAQTSTTEEEFLVIMCDLSQIEYYRQQWPFFRDRRIEAYQDLVKRFGK
ncbi:MAG: carbon-nitrogen hydrolase [Bacteroidia bacterium]|nr:carbon-nitrogen hydrolase [Bacteroidia bacterium]